VWSELLFAFGNVLLTSMWISYILVMSIFMNQLKRMIVQMFCVVPQMVCIILFRRGVIGMYRARLIETYLHVVLTIVMVTDTWVAREYHDESLLLSGTDPLFHLVIGWTLAPSSLHFVASQLVLTTYLNVGQLISHQFSPAIREVLVGNFFCYLTVCGYLAIGHFLNLKLQQRALSASLAKESFLNKMSHEVSRFWSKFCHSNQIQSCERLLRPFWASSRRLTRGG
jgi:hypothetical protein